MGKIKHKKTVVDGIEFDSKTEAEYYQYLKTLPDVDEIQLQPHYILLGSFQPLCHNCQGKGEVLNERTNNMNKCKRCDGVGYKDRLPWTYRADFDVLYKDGTKETIDVKGHANERFPLVKKMWEHQNKRELIVVKKKGKGWVRK